MTQTPTSSDEGRHSNEDSPLTQNWWWLSEKIPISNIGVQSFHLYFRIPDTFLCALRILRKRLRQAIRNCLSFPLNIYDFATPPIRGQCCLPKLEMGQYPQVRKYEIKSRWKFFKNKQFFLRKYQSCQLCQSMGMKSISHWKPKGHPIY